MEYINVYDFPIKYYPSNANIAANALSKKSAALDQEPELEEEPVTLASLCAEWLFIIGVS